jgi:hypothetical protein
MIRLFGGEVLDDPSQDFNITSGSDIQEGNTNLKIVISEVQPHLHPAKILSTLHVPFDNIYNLYMANSLILPLTNN